MFGLYACKKGSFFYIHLSQTPLLPIINGKYEIIAFLTNT